MTLQELYDGLIADLGEGTVDAEGRERIWEALKAASEFAAPDSPDTDSVAAQALREFRGTSQRSQRS